MATAYSRHNNRFYVANTKKRENLSGHTVTSARFEPGIFRIQVHSIKFTQKKVEAPLLSGIHHSRDLLHSIYRFRPQTCWLTFIVCSKFSTRMRNRRCSLNSHWTCRYTQQFCDNHNLLLGYRQESGQLLQMPLLFTGFVGFSHVDCHTSDTKTVLYPLTFSLAS